MPRKQMDLEQDAQAMDDALGTAIFYAKHMDDDESVSALILVRRRLEGHFRTVIYNRDVMQRRNEDERMKAMTRNLRDGL